MFKRGRSPGSTNKGAKVKGKGGRPPKGAKSAKAPSTPQVAAPKPSATQARQAINKTVLQNILETDKRVKNRQSQLAGELGQEIAAAVKRFGTNRKALNLIRQLNRMEAEDVALFLDDFDHMLDISGIEDRADAVQRLPLAGGENAVGSDDAGEEPEAEGEETDEGELAGEPGDPESAEPANVSRPQFGARAAAGSTVKH